MRTDLKTLRAAGLALALGAGLSTTACAPTEAEQRQQLSCAGGVVTGAAVGAVIGNQIGSGSGRKVATAGGAAAGGALGANAAC